jgi:hypothetical protein
MVNGLTPRNAVRAALNMPDVARDIDNFGACFLFSSHDCLNRSRRHLSDLDQPGEILSFLSGDTSYI